MVEIHCHGGVIAVQQVLERVLAQPGVRRARPGEFSQRAVLNGRLDLTQAEAISELVAARSRRAADLAMAGLDGGIQQRITALRERLLDQLTELEARVDFEEDLPPLDGEALLLELQRCGRSSSPWWWTGSGAIPCEAACGWPWWVAPRRQEPLLTGSASEGRS